jgi:hypothetical protein
VSLDGAKGMFADGLPSFVIFGVSFNVVIIFVYGILIFTSLDDAFGEFGALIF